jgi:hypothetical protein
LFFEQFIARSEPRIRQCVSIIEVVSVYRSLSLPPPAPSSISDLIIRCRSLLASFFSFHFYFILFYFIFFARSGSPSFIHVARINTDKQVVTRSSFPVSTLHIHSLHRRRYKMTRVSNSLFSFIALKFTDLTYNKS